MPTIYKYQVYKTPGPNGTTIWHTNTDENDISYLGHLDGYEYISVPDGIALPDQPTEIGIEQVALDNETKEWLRKNIAPLKITRRVAEARVREEVSDTADQLADLAKRIGVVERLVMRMAYFLLSDQAISQEVKDAYYPLVEEYINAVDGGLVEDRVDLESNVRLQSVLTDRYNAIAHIVDETHLKRVRRLLG